MYFDLPHLVEPNMFQISQNHGLFYYLNVLVTGLVWESLPTSLRMRDRWVTMVCPLIKFDLCQLVDPKHVFTLTVFGSLKVISWGFV